MYEMFKVIDFFMLQLTEQPALDKKCTLISCN